MLINSCLWVPKLAQNQNECDLPQVSLKNRSCSNKESYFSLVQRIRVGFGTHFKKIIILVTPNTGALDALGLAAGT